ncbi:MAG: chemotaxis protein CheW, partial [Alphaproteobacteria bacterium]|nr:chemotaxis protein CheW [Alphaproteobacteria bacterium]
MIDNSHKNNLSDDSIHDHYLTVKIGAQLFGFPVVHLRDIFKSLEITPIPLAPKAILGSINLRGKVVTVIDLRLKLFPNIDIENRESMHIAVAHGQELLSFVVDSVGDVINIPQSQFEPLPSTLEQHWLSITDGVCQLNESLMIKLNMEHLLDLITREERT